ncbi:MAG: hypothetical protein ACYYK0_05170 [Candidatus Eutrophobiaceae bacterium]
MRPDSSGSGSAHALMVGALLRQDYAGALLAGLIAVYEWAIA